MALKANGRPPHGGQNSPFSKETLLRFLFDDLGSSGLPIYQQDIATMLRRSASEGPRFMYVTLKQIASLLLSTLETGVIPPQTSFTCLAETKIPKFLGGLWSNIIRTDGTLRPDYCSDESALNCASALLQIGTSFSKYADSFPKELIPHALDEFVSTDAGLSSIQYPESLLSAAANEITVLFARFNLADIVPKHGPGAVSTGERQEGKWTFNRRYVSADEVYPWTEYMCPGWDSDLESRVVQWLRLERIETGTAKIIVVPKTSTDVRIISAEPLELMFLQQGQMSLMVEHLEHHPHTRGHVNFTDQTVNRNLALINSATKEFATIDLSAASDRLSLQLVKHLFVNCDDNMLRCLLATRSTHTILPDGRTVEMQKFAPMGSAVCFPVQSISFFALCVAAISIAAKLPSHQVRKLVYVYGDDIIVPSKHVQCVADALTSVGLKVNREKSFSEGSFRESCGIFAIHGKDITPVRFKTAFPLSIKDGRGLSAWIAYAHECEKRGYHQTAEYIYETIESVIGKLPYGYSGSSYYCRWVSEDTNLSVHNMDWPVRRWNKTLHRREIKALGPTSRYRDVVFEDGDSRLLRDLLTSFVDSDPTKVVLPNSTKTKFGWHSVQ